MKSLMIVIVKYLRGQLASNQLTPSAAEGVEVAIQCLEDAYDIIPADLQRSVLRLEDLLRATIRVPEDVAELTQEQKEQAENLKLLGNELVREGNYEEAIETYSRAIEIDANNAVFFCNRAAAHIQRRNYIAGINDCEEAVRLDPAYSKAYSRMGYAYQSIGNRGKAKENYEKAIQLDPDNEGYKSSLRKIEDIPGTSGTGTPAQIELNSMLPGIDLTAIMRNPAFMQMASQMLEDPGLQTAVSRVLAGQSSFPLAHVQELISAGQQLAFHLRNEVGGAASSTDQPDAPDEENAESEEEEVDEEEEEEYDNEANAADFYPFPDVADLVDEPEVPILPVPILPVPILPMPIQHNLEEHNEPQNNAPVPAAEERVLEPVANVAPAQQMNNPINGAVEGPVNIEDPVARGDNIVPPIPFVEGPHYQDMGRGGGDADRRQMNFGAGGDADRPRQNF